MSRQPQLSAIPAPAPGTLVPGASAAFQSSPVPFTVMRQKQRTDGLSRVLMIGSCFLSQVFLRSAKASVSPGLFVNPPP